MASGSNQIVTYEEVAAYQANQGIATYANGSPGEGTLTGGFWVNWDEVNGYQDTYGWNMGPTKGMTPDEVSAAIANGGGTLNDVFANWGAPLSEKLAWASQMAEVGCAYEVEQ